LYLSFFRKQFKPDLSFSLFTFSSGEAFLNKFKRDQGNKNLKIVILDYVLNSEDINARTGLELLPIIKEIDKFAEIVILSGFDNMDVKATSNSKYPFDYIKKNDHTFVRLYSTINTIMSTYNLKKKRQDMKIAWYVFGVIGTLLISCLILLFIFSSQL